MSATIQVKVGGRGVVVDGEASEDTSVEAQCDLCGETVDAVVSVAADSGGAHACKSCLRHRLESVTVALYLLREPGRAGLPWGKITS
jgi:hypothetical protein